MVGRKGNSGKAKGNDGEAYKTIFKNLPFVAFTLDRSGRILEANEYTEKLTGLKAKGVIGKKFSELGLLGKKDLIRAFLEFRKNLQGKVTEKTVYTARLKDGREVLLELIGIPLKEGGKVTKVLDVGSNITERKKIEEELKEKEEKNRFISESTRDIILIIDKTGKILFTNKRALEASGYAENEMMGKSIASFLTKDSIKTAFYVLAKEFLGQPQKKIELKIKTKSGEIRYLEVDEGSASVREKGKTVGILVTGRDITERKEAEEELKNSEERFRMLFEYAPDAYYLNDMKGNFLEGNLAAENLTGYKKNELLRGNMFKLKLLSKEQLPKAASLLAKNALGKSTGPDEFVLSRKDGSKVNVEIMTYPVKIGGQKLTLGIARNVTERRKAEEKLKTSEEKYRAIIETAPDGIVTADLKGIITTCNRAFADLTGYPKEELMGKQFTKLPTLRARDTLKYVKLFATLMRGKLPAEPTNIVWVRKDGTECWGEMGFSLIKEGSKITGVQAVLRDITERKNAEKELRESEERYRAQFEEALDAIIIAEAKTGIIVDCNRAATELVERDRSELIGQHQKILHPPEDTKGQFSETFKKHLAEAKGQTLETHVITKKGKLKDVTIKANLIELGGKKLLQGIFRDITEQKKAQNVISENENTYRIAAEQTGQITYDYDIPSGRIKWLGAITELTGYGFEEFQKKDINDWGNSIHPDDREKALSLLEKALKEGTKYDAEYRFMRKDGNYVYIEDIGTVLKNAEGKSFRMLGTMKDITERKSAGEEIRKRTEELEKINKLSVGRELKMVDLKKRISELENQLKEKSG